jgi:zinc finger protein
MEKVNRLENQLCPVCNKKTLALVETSTEVPYLGEVFLFSMSCSTCKYHKSDVEASEKKEPMVYSIEVESEDDLKVRVVKSSEGKVKIPHVMTIEPGPSSNGYITNVEGVLNRVKAAIEIAKEAEDDPAAKKKAKKLLKKVNKVLWGQEKIKIIIEDKSGNSAIISDKAVKKEL